MLVVLCLVIGTAGRLAAGERPDDAGASRRQDSGGEHRWLPERGPQAQAPASFNAGYSFYTTAWPLVEQYQGHEFQSGLYGTWMFAQYDGPRPDKLYSDIEGGLGWWTDTRFPTETPKFIMGGGGAKLQRVGQRTGGRAGSGLGPTQRQVDGVAQLSPWLLWPPDGLNVKQGTCGELFGYVPIATREEWDGSASPPRAH